MNKAYPIIVISLKSDVERREEISRVLNALDLDFTFLDAIDGRHGLPTEFESMIDRERTLHAYHRKMTDGEYACALTHLSSYRMIVDRKLPGAYILEDDAIVDKRFARMVKEEFHLLAPIIVYYHRNARVLRFARKKVSNGVSLRKLAVPPFGCVAYSMSNAAANWYLSKAVPVTRTADWSADISEFGAWAVDPPVVDHPQIRMGQSNLIVARRTRNTFSITRYLSARYIRQKLRKIVSIKIS